MSGTKAAKPKPKSVRPAFGAEWKLAVAAKDAQIARLREALAECARVEQRDARNDVPFTIHDGDGISDLASNERSRRAWNAAHDALALKADDAALVALVDLAIEETRKTMIAFGDNYPHFDAAKVRARVLDRPAVHLWSPEHSANWCGVVSFRDLSAADEEQANCAACLRARAAGEIK